MKPFQRDAEHLTPSTPAKPAVSAACRHLCVEYAGATACRDINLDIPDRRITALIGSSGCGKTSILSALTGMYRYIQGCHVRGDIFFGKNRASDLPPCPSQLGIIFQTPTPFPFSILKNFQIPLKEAGLKDRHEIEQRMQTALRRVGLWDEVSHKLKHNAQHLSGGQQQRLCMARALALQPKTMFLDEPCSALDAISSRRIEELLQDLSADMPIFMVTHNINQTRRLADHMYVMGLQQNAGTIVEYGDTPQLFDQPQHPVTRALVSV